MRRLFFVWIGRILGRGDLPAAVKAVALAVYLQDVHVVGGPVQQCSGEPF